MRKFNNKKVKFDGYTFDSIAESQYYRLLSNMKDKGKIKDFEVHPTFILQKSFRYKNKGIRAITYTSDFKVVNNDGTIDIVDVKGVKTNEFKIKEKILKYMYKDDENVNIYCTKLIGDRWVRI